MQGEIVSSDQQIQTTSLGERLDPVIGETSSGIGALMGELVRRSLKEGVSGLGDSLVEYAEEKVENAVQQQMPVISEAADAVAESTSKRVIKDAVHEINEKSAKEFFDVRQRLDETRNLAVEGNDSSERKIEELREKARRSWHKLMEELTSVNTANEKLRAEQQQLRTAIVEQTQAAEQRYSALLSQNQLLEERLAALEQPRGIKKLFSKIMGGGKKKKTPRIEAPNPGPNQAPGAEPAG